MTDHHITLERRYAADRRHVFEAWTRPALLRRWAFGGVSRDTKSVRIDLFPGGRLELVQRGGLDRKRRWGRFREVHAPRRLAFSWRSDGWGLHGVPTRVTVEIEGTPGESVLRLTQEGFPDECARDAGRAAWEELLDRLDELLRDS